MVKVLKPLNELISLRGKRSLITGSAVGIGRAIAYRFAEAGSDLELVDTNSKGLRMLKKELSQFKSEVNIHRVDMSQKEQIDSLWEELSGEEPDILVNNVGTYPFKNFMEVDNAFYEKVMDINLNAAFWMCQHMVKRRPKTGGIIINVSSIEAILPFEKDLVPYSVSKSGVITLTRALAKEYGSRGFRINVIVPGGIITPGTKAVAQELYHLKMGRLQSGLRFSLRLPLGRAGQPDEVARIALVLASDMSSYVHGALIPVDGGFLSA